MKGKIIDTGDRNWIIEYKEVVTGMITGSTIFDYNTTSNVKLIPTQSEIFNVRNDVSKYNRADVDFNIQKIAECEYGVINHFEDTIIELRKDPLFDLWHKLLWVDYPEAVKECARLNPDTIEFNFSGVIDILSTKYKLLESEK